MLSYSIFDTKLNVSVKQPKIYIVDTIFAYGWIFIFFIIIQYLQLQTKKYSKATGLNSKACIKTPPQERVK